MSWANARLRKRTLIATVPRSLMYSAGYLLLRPLVRVSMRAGPHLPDRALVYALHENLLPGILCAKYVRHIVWVNNDTAGGVASAFPALIAGLRLFRLHRESPVSRPRQLVSFLNATDRTVGLFADGERLDRNVRGSLARLALATNRPLVPVRVITSRSRRFRGHVYPLPLSAVVLEFGAPVSPPTLAAMPPEEIPGFLTLLLRPGGEE